MTKVWAIANLYVATLRAIYLIEQHCHWTVKGTAFYGDHLLFERLYKSAQDNADLAAEKAIGCFGQEAVEYKSQCELMHKIVAKYADLQDKPVEQALAIEKDFLAMAEKAFKQIEEAGEMDLGIDDMMTEISSKRQEAVYLLGQVLKKANQSPILTRLAQLAITPQLAGFLGTALSTAVANAGNIASSFHGELRNNEYVMFFTPPLNKMQQTKLLTSMHTFIKLNKPELEGQITLKFA